MHCFGPRRELANGNLSHGDDLVTCNDAAPYDSQLYYNSIKTLDIIETKHTKVHYMR